ncbi:MAG: DUF4440 domain-containing protein [Pseudoxanthomonas sp.]
MDAVLAAHLCELERRLLDPVVRTSAAALQALLAPSFVEFGASGRRFDRTELLSLLPGEEDFVCSAGEFEAVMLAPDLVQLRYVSTLQCGGTLRRARRSSLWQRDTTGWRMLFHQGTPIPDQA